MKKQIVIVLVTIGLSPMHAQYNNSQPVKLKIDFFDKHAWIDDGMDVEGVGFSISLPEKLMGSPNFYIGILGFGLGWEGTKDENSSLYDWEAARKAVEYNWRSGNHSALSLTISYHIESQNYFTNHMHLTGGLTFPGIFSLDGTSTLPWSEFGKEDQNWNEYSDRVPFFRASFRPIKRIPGTVSIQVAKVPERGWYPTFAFGFEPIIRIPFLKY